MDTKPCFKCGETKPLSDYYTHKRMADGHLGKCKDCTKRDARLRYEEKREAINAYDRMRNKLPHRVARDKARENLPHRKTSKQARNVKRRAIKRNAKTGDRRAIAAIYKRAASKASIKCYLCRNRIPIGKRHVDHIIPLSKGGSHSPENLAIACAFCNVSKGNKPPHSIGLLL